MNKTSEVIDDPLPDRCRQMARLLVGLGLKDVPEDVRLAIGRAANLIGWCGDRVEHAEWERDQALARADRDAKALELACRERDQLERKLKELTTNQEAA